MEEEMRQGMMGADVQTTSAENKPMEINITAREVSNNLQNLNEEEKELLIQLNIPTYSKDKLPKELLSIDAIKPGSRNL